MSNSHHRYMKTIGWIVVFITVIFGTYRLVPTRLDIAWVFLLASIAAAIGGGLWNLFLKLLKDKRLEDVFTSPFGGSREPTGYGGVVFGAVYFFPMAVLLGTVSVKVHQVSPQKALASPAVFLLGTAVGGALFYGLGMRERCESLRMSYLSQESLLSVVWSALLLLPSFVAYASVLGRSDALIENVIVGVMAGLSSVVLCFLFVLGFIIVSTTEDDRFEDARGLWAGFVIIVAATMSAEYVLTRFLG